MWTILRFLIIVHVRYFLLHWSHSYLYTLSITDNFFSSNTICIINRFIIRIMGGNKLSKAFLCPVYLQKYVCHVKSIFVFTFSSISSNSSQAITVWKLIHKTVTLWMCTRDIWCSTFTLASQISDNVLKQLFNFTLKWCSTLKAWRAMRKINWIQLNIWI